MPRSTAIPELDDLRGWNKLNPQEQSTVQKESRSLAESLYSEGKSRLAIGQHLQTISSILAPKKLFDNFLRRHFHMTKSTAYNYINLWKAAAKDAPKPVLDIAMTRNYRVINRPQIFKTYPPPKTTNPEKIIQYLDRLETRKPKIVTIHKNRDGLLKQALHSVEVCFEKVAVKERADFARTLIGMEMTRFGFGVEQTFKPLPIPPSMVVPPRGRPKAA